MAKKIQLQDANGNVLHPLTLGECVTMNNGENLDTLMSKSQMFTPTITQDKSMFKVGTGADVDYSANVKDGAYEGLVFKGKSLVNLITKYRNNNTSQTLTISGRTYVVADRRDMPLKSNTKYLIQFNVSSLNLDGRTSVDLVFQQNAGVIFDGNVTASIVQTGVHSVVATTIPSLPVVTDSDWSQNAFVIKGMASQWENSTSTERTLTISDVMVIEYQQGMENWDIPYFTGICDSKMPILRNVGSLHPFPNGLLCWYDARSGEGEQTLLEDLSGNENHATLRNFQFGGTDGWQDGGIRTVGYGAATGKNSIRTNKQINNAKSMCIYFKRLGSTTPWYLFDGRESSTLYWYSGGYSGINRSNSSKNGVQLSGNNDAVLPEIGNTAMVYIEFTDNIPITPTLMGRHSGNESLDGVFYAFMLYDRALTTEEVAMNMEYAKSFDYIKDISPLDFRNIDKTNILRTSEEIVLREVNGVQDTYNPLTGEYVQRIGEVVLNGSENEWEDWSETSFVLRGNYFSDAVEHTAVTAPRLKCNNMVAGKGETPRTVRYYRSPTVLWTMVGKNNGETLDQFKTWLSQNPTTIQYILAEPITTIIKPSTMTPFAYQNGHVIVESGFEGQSLLPEIEYSVVTGRTGQVTQNTKVLRQQEQQIIGLEELLLTQVVQMEYERTLLQFDYELQMMMLG